jgi:general stress protein 26
MKEHELKERLNELFSDQRLAVLSSNLNDQPYPSLIAFAHTDDLKYLYFATLRNSIKYSNIKDNPKISMLVDNRGNSPSDISEAIAVSVFGFAKETDCEDQDCHDIYLRKHPYLKEFISMPDCALIKIKVEKFKLVSNFQDVETLQMD